MVRLRWQVVVGAIFVAGLVTGCARMDAAEKDAAGTPAVVAADPSKGRGGKGGVAVKSDVRVNLRTREFRLVVPATIDPATAVPVVFAFHGMGDTVDSMAKYTELDRLAEKEKFILVYPVGTKKQWRITPDAAANDLDFFDLLYERLGEQYNIDRNRVYAVGISNGAFFVNLLAAERSDKVAAIVSHSGGIGLVGERQPKVSRKYAVMIVHGVADDVISIETAWDSRDLYKKWGFPVEYVELPKLGHEWALKEGINAKIWKFFQEHPKSK